ncbi:hypothetical protein LC55x_1436 [Lysobacter capsici]|nr:hypothetical protein LC55x_1436 [Lysobacter capsici]
MKVVTRARGPDAGGTCLRVPSSGPSGHLLSSALPSVAASGRRIFRSLLMIVTNPSLKAPLPLAGEGLG